MPPTKTGRILEPIPRDDGESRAEWIKRIGFSARGYRAHLTTQLRTAQDNLKAFQAAPNEVGFKQLQAKAHALDDAMARLRDRYQDLMDQAIDEQAYVALDCLLYTSPSPRDS